MPSAQTIITDVFAAIGAVFAIIQIYKTIAGRGRLFGELEYGTCFLPPEIDDLLTIWRERNWPTFLTQRVTAFNGQELATANRPLMDIVSRIIQEEMSQAASVSYAGRLNSLWILRLHNKGNAKLTDVIVHTPPVMFYSIRHAGGQASGYAARGQPEFTRISVGAMAPDHSVMLWLWSAEDASLRAAVQFAIVHASGRGTMKVDWRGLPPRQRIVTRSFVFSIMLLLGLIGLIILRLLQRNVR
jgi:hypothetical protein